MTPGRETYKGRERRIHFLGGGSAAGFLGWRAEGTHTCHLHATLPLFRGGPPFRPSSPRRSHSSRRERAGGSAAGQSELSNPRKAQGQELPSTYRAERVNRKPPEGGSSAPEGQAAPNTGADSLTPRFRAVTGQPGTGPAGGRPIASRRCPRTSQSRRGGGVNSNGNSTLHVPRRVTTLQIQIHPASRRRRARGRGRRRERGPRGAIARQKGRCSTSGSDPSPASLGLRHGG